MRDFGELESVVMDRMWSEEGPLSVRDMVEWLQGQRQVAYTTVMTVMSNLHRKGWLRRVPRGRAYVYEPVASREQYSAKLMSEAFAQSDDPAATLTRFVETISKNEAAALRQLLDDHKRTDQ